MNSSTGKIATYFSNRGFGFIHVHGQQTLQRIYFHISDWKSPVDPEVGQTVRFEVSQRPKGTVALNIFLDDPFSDGARDAFVGKVGGGAQ